MAWPAYPENLHQGGTGEHFVSLDTVIETMRLTGKDMSERYKETAMGGLAVTAVPVSVPDC